MKKISHGKGEHGVCVVCYPNGDRDECKEFDVYYFETENEALNKFNEYEKELIELYIKLTSNEEYAQMTKSFGSNGSDSRWYEIEFRCSQEGKKYIRISFDVAPEEDED